MSNKKKNSKASENIKLGASTLINNAACIEMGRTRHWYSAIIAAILAIVVAVVPLMVTQFSTSGSQLLNSPTCDLDSGLVAFQEELNNKNISMTINHETKEMAVTNWQAIENNQTRNSWVEPNGFIEVFWADLEGDALSTYASNVTKDIDHNFAIFGKKAFMIGKYSTGQNGSSSLSGQYDRFTIDFDLKDFVKMDSKGEQYTTTKSDVDSNPTLYENYFNNSISAWKMFLADGYHTLKIHTAWRWTGIMCGVFAIFVFFMGLMIFLMTRGKHNPYKIYTFWETQKIAYWAAFSPAVIGMVLGFMIPNMAMMGFIFTYGLRVMWLATKSLRPM